MDDDDATLQHYASEYYDPVKAREYYLRTRELKGRTSANLKTEKKKIGWDYAKSQIDEKKQTELDAAAEANVKALDDFKTSAMAKRDEIQTKLKEILKQVNDQVVSIREQLAQEQEAVLSKISSDAEAKIAALPEIPAGLSKERTAELRSERQAKIQEIRNDASLERSDTRKQFSNSRKALANEASTARETVRENAAAKREELSSNLKATVETARANYVKLRDDIKAKYEQTYQTEYDAIKSKV